MGAIYGQIGANALAEMAGALVHRGGEVTETDGLGALAPARISRLPDTEITIAIAGTVTPSDPETIVEYFRGDQLDRLRGSFVIAIHDGDAVHLIRDGAGRRTIYHARLGDGHVFAIEPKALHRLPQFDPRVRPAAVAEYLTFSFIPGSGTMLEDLHEVPAGHVVTLRAGAEPTSRRWFRPEEVEPETLNDAAWIERFRQGFGGAIDRMRQPGKPAAVFLSGGIDSSIVTAELAARHDAPVQTYAVHFGEHLPNELEHARAVAEHCGTRHEEVLVQPRDFLPSLPDIVEALDEPIGDPVAMPNYLLARHVAVAGFDRVFNGEGGDPCFGGPKNLPLLLSHWYGGQDYAPGHRERAYLASYRRAFEELEHLLHPDFRAQIKVERDLEQHLTPFFQTASPERFLDKMLAINIRLKGAHLILPKVERMLAAHRMQPLSPLFDEDLIRLVFQLPGHLKLAGGIEKIILKRAYRGHLPDSIIDRPKSGMRVPVHHWFQKELKRYARDVLHPRELAKTGIFDPKRVRQLLRYESEHGPGRFGIRLWMLVTFQLWARNTLR